MFNYKKYQNNTVELEKKPLIFQNWLIDWIYAEPIYANECYFKMIMNHDEDDSYKLTNISISDEYTDNLLGIFVVSFDIKHGNLIGKRK